MYLVQTALVCHVDRDVMGKCQGVVGTCSDLCVLEQKSDGDIWIVVERKYLEKESTSQGADEPELKDC